MATTEPTTKQQIDDLLDTLSPRDQARVLAYARSLNELPEGVSGQELVDFFHQFAVSPEEAEAMTRIYEEIGVLRGSSEQIGISSLPESPAWRPCIIPPLNGRWLA